MSEASDKSQWEKAFEEWAEPVGRWFEPKEVFKAGWDASQKTLPPSLPETH